MRTSKLLFAWGLLVWLVASCGGNHFLPEERGEAELTPQATNIYQRSEAEAKQEALEFLEGFTTPTRTIAPVFTRTHYILTEKQDVRNVALSILADTSLFVIELADGGSVLVTGDRRNEAILAYTETNSIIELFNDVERDSNELYLLIEEYLQQTPNRTLPVQELDVRSYMPRDPANAPWKKVLTIHPLLHTSWHQGKPYNNCAPYIKKKKRNAVAGCAAIAMGQVLAYHKYPARIDNLELDWSHILTTIENEEPNAAPLIRKLGDHLRNKWGHDATGAKPQHLPKALRYVTYEASDYESFNEEKIVADLIEKRPLIFRANRSTSKVIGITVGYRNGHAWVVDGVTVYEKNNSSTSSIAQNHKPIKRYHFHCNWGWGGRYNGYYETNLFKPGLEATNPNTETRGSNYNKNLQVCYGIKPRN